MNSRLLFSKGFQLCLLACVLAGVTGITLAFVRARAAATRVAQAHTADSKWDAVAQHVANLRIQLEPVKSGVSKAPGAELEATLQSLAADTAGSELNNAKELHDALEKVCAEAKELHARSASAEKGHLRPQAWVDLANQAALLEGKLQAARLQWLADDEAASAATQSFTVETLFLALGALLLLIPVFAYVSVARQSDAREQALRDEAAAKLQQAHNDAAIATAKLSEQLSNEKKLAAKNETRLATITDLVANSSMILWAIDARGVYLFREGKGLTDLGHTPGQGVGKHFSDLKAVRLGSNENFNRALTGETFAAEFQEGERWFNTRFSPMKDASGAIKGVCGISTDVTSRRSAEQREIQEEGVRQATRLKSEFMANMSHELRTPMNGIVGMVGLLESTSLSEEQKGMLDVIQSSTDSLLKTVNDIIDLSKLETGKAKLSEADFVPSLLIQDILKRQAVAAQQKGLELILDLGSGTRNTVSGDPDRFQQVISNIVENAIKYTKSGHVLVQVRATPTVDKKTQLNVSISDTGPGIEKSRLAELLKPYNSQGGISTRKVGDVGFGLSIAKMVVGLMGGTLVIESEIGRGTSVEVVVALPTKAAQASEGANEVRLRGKRILIVDDCEVMRGILALKLSALGADVDVSSNGQDALSSCAERLEKEAPFDVALVDRFMPKMDGATFAALVRAQKGMASLPLVLLAPPSEPLEAGKRALFNAEVAKPIDEVALGTTLKALLNSEPVAAEKVEVAKLTTGFDETPLKILVADDNAVNVAVCKKMLSRLGHSVVTVTNGEEVLSELAKRSFDALFIDCQMPVVDGYEATRRIRASKTHWNNLWIVAVTANASVADRQNCFDAGMDDFLPKPLRIPSVDAAITLLRQNQQLYASGHRGSQS